MWVNWQFANLGLKRWIFYVCFLDYLIKTLCNTFALLKVAQSVIFKTTSRKMMNFFLRKFRVKTLITTCPTTVENLHDIQSHLYMNTNYASVLAHYEYVTKWCVVILCKILSHNWDWKHKSFNCLTSHDTFLLSRAKISISHNDLLGVLVNDVGRCVIRQRCNKSQLITRRQSMEHIDFRLFK